MHLETIFIKFAFGRTKGSVGLALEGGFCVFKCNRREKGMLKVVQPVKNPTNLYIVIEQIEHPIFQ